MKEHFLCTICPCAKQTRMSFLTSSIKTSKSFEMIHIDIWDPYSQVTHGHYNMFLTIVDDFSRCTWIFLLKHKSDDVTHLINFILFAGTQYSAQVKCVRSDNAKESSEGDALKFYKSKGIFHQTSYTYTPQQNGIVERKHRHLLEIARALFFSIIWLLVSGVIVSLLLPILLT